MMKQKILSFLLTVLLTATAFGMKTEAAEPKSELSIQQAIQNEAALAEEEIEVIVSGWCGNTDIEWGITSDGMLLIVGNGKMPDYDGYDRPWYDYKDSIYAVGVQGTVEHIGETAFQACNNLEYAYIEEGVKSIGAKAFWGCSNLLEVDMASTVTSIGSLAFRSCYNLSIIELPPGLKSIPISMFTECTNLRNITIPNSVTRIESSAFSSCINLTSIKIPKQVTEIHQFAFANCKKLASVNLPSSLQRIARDTFYGCAIKTINIPSSVKDIQENAFAYTQLEKISIPNSVTAIGKNAFQGCTKLKEVDLPDAIKLIEESIFVDCSSLTTISIPSQVTEIKYKAFYGCSSLTNVRIPASVTWIAHESFGNCPNLNKVYVMNELARLNLEVFANHGKNLQIYCYENSVAHRYAMEKNIPYKFLDMSLVTDYFADVPENEWYKDAVQYVFDKGLMSGSGEYFNPAKDMTRAQLVTTLYRLAGSPEVTDYSACHEFSDVLEGQYYTEPVCWAYNEGITTGSSGMFNTSGNLTRQQLAAFFFRYANAMGYDTTQRGDYSSLLNADQVADYAQESMEWAVGAGLISGSKTTDAAGNTVYDLKPQGNTTRAQLATILQRFCEKYEIFHGREV